MGRPGRRHWERAAGRRLWPSLFGRLRLTTPAAGWACAFVLAASAGLAGWSLGGWAGGVLLVAAFFVLGSSGEWAARRVEAVLLPMRPNADAVDVDRALAGLSTGLVTMPAGADREVLVVRCRRCDVPIVAGRLEAAGLAA